MGWKTIPVVYVNIPDLKEEQELNLRLNKNLGHWDWDMLANFSEDLLKEVGFESEELKMYFDLNDIDNLVIDEERLNVIYVEFPESPRLKEKLAFYCDNLEEVEEIKKFFEEKDGKLNKEKLFKLIKKYE
jgi:hypothetical protein